MTPAHITPVLGRPLSYLVPSRKKLGESYLVDLTDYHGNGSCTCNDFSCRCVANMKKPHQLFTDATMCHHMRLAHVEFMGGVLDEILAK
jgi:hypothetical protein